jgi:O-antigen/teichoic acid export membrane protein
MTPRDDVRLKLRRLVGPASFRLAPVLAARIGSVVCQFLFMILLARLMDREAFANFMLAYGILRLASGGLANGSCALLARRAAVTGPLTRVDDKFFQFLLIFTLGVAITVAFSAAAAYQLAYRPIDFSDKVGWWLGLAPMFILGVGAPLEMARLDLRGDVNAATLWADLLPNALRVLMVLILAASSLKAWQISLIICITQAVPLCPEILTWRRGGLAPRPHGHFNLLFYCNYVVQYFLGTQVMGVDLLLLAFAIQAPDAAEYIVAIRLLSFSSFIQTIVTRQFASLLSDAVRNNDRDRLQDVILDANVRSFYWTIFSIGALLFFGPILFRVFGKQYTFSSALLCQLSIVFILYGTIANAELLMRLKGMANIELGVLTAGTALFVISAVGFGKHSGAIAVAFGLTASACFFVVTLSVICRRRLRISLFDRTMIFGLLISLVLIGIASRFQVGSTAWNASSLTLGLVGCSTFIRRPNAEKLPGSRT